jgi:hypothetical protein
VVAGTGVTSWGSTRALLGRLAARLGQPETAIGNLAAAVAHNHRLGARPFEARARGDLALLVSRHPALTSDLGPVADIVAPAVVIARAVGMQALLAELDDLVRKTREPGRGQPVTSNRATT